MHNRFPNCRRNNEYIARNNSKVNNKVEAKL